MSIENIITDIKNEYINLLDGNLERYIVEPASVGSVNEITSKFDIVLPPDFVWFITKSDIRIAIEGAYDTFDMERVGDLLERMNKRLDEGAFNGLAENIDGEPSPLMKNVWWNKKWIPFAEDGGGNLMCIDLDPAEKGVLGQIIGFERVTGPYPTEYKSFNEFSNYQLEFARSGGLNADSDGLLS